MRARLAIVAVAFAASAAARLAASADAPIVSVRDSDEGVYEIAARFIVPQSAAIVRAVLTDYDNIPRFMPHMRSSRVVGRQEGSVRVEQEAVSRFLLFSKRIHLVLDIEEGAAVIRFRDLCNESFASYEGTWTIREQPGGTEVTYELSARPAFSVPALVIRKLFNRDATVMIERLRKEFSAREPVVAR
jgi:ribosome-associated toxin RatA of RatAB toxin-antitoxin module